MNIKKKVYKILLIFFWAAFYLLGCLLAPFGTYDPHTGLSCILFFLSILSVFVLSIYEYRIDERSKPFVKYALDLLNLAAYLPNVVAYIQIWIALTR